MRRLISFLIVLLLMINGALASIEADKNEQTVDNPDDVYVIIGYKDKVTEVHENSLKIKGAKIRRTFNEINAISVIVSKKTLEQLSTDSNIEYIVPNEKVLKIASTIESIPWGINKVNVPLVYNDYNGNGVIVAVIDTGVDYTHVDLADSGKFVPGYDYVNHDNDPMDDNGHGTHVAGTIAANRNGFGVVGVASGSQIMSLKMLDSGGSGYLDDGVSAILYASDNNAKIISMSWGCNCDYAPLHSAIQTAYSHGVLLIAAAGNNANSVPFYPASYAEVMSISATTETDGIAYFSNYGNKIEVSAPGYNIQSTYPGNRYEFMSGTSMAAPHVSGAAAVLWQQNPSFSNEQIRTLIDRTAYDLGVVGKDIYFGFGRLDLSTAVYPPPLPTITVSTPNGGENWNRGIPNEIRWSSANNPGTNVVITLLKNGIVDSTIASTTNFGSYFWTIPSSKATGTTYKIRITSDNTLYSDDSDDNFTISALVNPIIITSPAEGDQWKRSANYIRWSGSEGTVKIELLQNNVYRSTIATNVANSGTYRWNTPKTVALGDNYKIKITSKLDGTKIGTSNVFSVIR